MRSRYPAVFRNHNGPIFRRTRKDRVNGLGPNLLFAECLTEKGSPDQPMVFCEALGRNTFLRYEPSTGLYRALTPQMAWQEADHLLGKCAEGSRRDRKAVHLLRDNRTLSSIVEGVRAVGNVSASFFDPRRDLRHVGNGVIDLKELTLLPFTPAMPSLTKVEVDWEPEAKRPRRFVGWLRQMFPSPADRDLALSVMALALLGNPLQRLVVLRGPGGSGKSTFVKLLAGLLGPGASGQLRLDQVNSRFEAQRWAGKLMLHADEATGKLNRGAAEELKRLSGQDTYEAEVKNSNVGLEFVPKALPILVANGRIEIPLNGDLDAWMRRLVVLDVSRTATAGSPIPNFERVLLKAEGAGILRLVASRAGQMLLAMDRGRAYPLLAPEQQSRVDVLLGCSDPIRTFVEECIRRQEGGQLYGGEARKVAREWLQMKGYSVPSARQLSRDLKHHVESAGGLESNSLPAHGTHSSRGWRQVVLSSEE